MAARARMTVTFIWASPGWLERLLDGHRRESRASSNRFRTRGTGFRTITSAERRVIAHADASAPDDRCPGARVPVRPVVAAGGSALAVLGAAGILRPAKAW